MTSGELIRVMKISFHAQKKRREKNKPPSKSYSFGRDGTDTINLVRRTPNTTLTSRSRGRLRSGEVTTHADDSKENQDGDECKLNRHIRLR